MILFIWFVIVSILSVIDATYSLFYGMRYLKSATLGAVEITAIILGPLIFLFM